MCKVKVVLMFTFSSQLPITAGGYNGLLFSRGSPKPNDIFFYLTQGPDSNP